MARRSNDSVQCVGPSAWRCPRCSRGCCHQEPAETARHRHEAGPSPLCRSRLLPRASRSSRLTESVNNPVYPLAGSRREIRALAVLRHRERIRHPANLRNDRGYQQENCIVAGPEEFLRRRALDGIRSSSRTVEMLAPADRGTEHDPIDPASGQNEVHRSCRSHRSASSSTEGRDAIAGRPRRMVASRSAPPRHVSPVRRHRDAHAVRTGASLG